MKQFDVESIYLRLKDKAKKKANIAQVAEDSVLNGVLWANADMHSEIARYLEYLLAEKKWDTAQNLTSLIKQAKIVGYRPKRRRSAIGEIIVSHDERLTNFGLNFFDLNESSECDSELTQNQANSPSGNQANALRPWTQISTSVGSAIIPAWGSVPAPSSLWKISAGDVFSAPSSTTGQEIQFIALTDKQIRYYNYNFTSAVRSRADFSWEGYKYLRIPVIQGIKRSKNIQLPTNQNQISNFTIIGLESVYIEDARNNYSKNLLTVSMSGGGLDDVTLLGNWKRVDSIFYYGPYDKVYEVYPSDDMSVVYFKFGNGITGAKPPAGGIVTVNYIETLGENGNINTRFTIRQIVSSGNTVPVTLYCTNDSKVLGGLRPETIDDVRKNAPIDYLNYYSIGTIDSYESIIKNNISNIGNLKVFSGTKYTIDGSSTIKSDVVFVSAIDSVGSVIKDTATSTAATSLLSEIVDIIGDRKSPTDTLSYKDPASIELRYSLTIRPINSATLSASTALALVKSSLSPYIILNRSFNASFYEGQARTIVSNIKDSSGTLISQSVNSLLEVGITLDLTNHTYDPINKVIYFHFQFDRCFGQDPSNFGFKSGRDNGKAILMRADITWGSAFISKNRSLLLVDQRSSSDPKTDGAVSGYADYAKLRTIQTTYNAATIFSTSEITSYISSDIQYYQKSNSGTHLKVLDSGAATPSNWIKNSQYIGPDDAASYSGESKVFGTPSLRVPKILFDETGQVTEEPEEQLFGKGSIALPVGKLGDEVMTSSYIPEPTTDISTVVNQLISQNGLKIKVYAEPKIYDIVADRPNVIFSIPQDDIAIKLT